MMTHSLGEKRWIHAFLSEMQIAMSWIWTQVVDSISCGSNCL